MLRPVFQVTDFAVNRDLHRLSRLAFDHVGGGLAGSVAKHKLLAPMKRENYIETRGRTCLAKKRMTASKSARTHNPLTANQK